MVITVDRSRFRSALLVSQGAGPCAKPSVQCSYLSLPAAISLIYLLGFELLRFIAASLLADVRHFIILLDASRRLIRSRGAADVEGNTASQRSPQRSKHGGSSSSSGRRERRRSNGISYNSSSSGKRKRRGGSSTRRRSGSSNSRWIPAAAEERRTNREVSSAVQQSLARAAASRAAAVGTAKPDNTMKKINQNLYHTVVTDVSVQRHLQLDCDVDGIGVFLRAPLTFFFF